MSNSGNPGSRLFPGRGERPAISSEQVEFSVDFYLYSGAFAKIDDQGVYATKMKAVMADPLENLKNMLADSPVISRGLAADYLAEAYIRAIGFARSVESKEYLPDFVEGAGALFEESLIADVYECMEKLAESCFALEEFKKHVEEKRIISAAVVRSRTIPYGSDSLDANGKPFMKAPFLAPGYNEKNLFSSTAVDLPAMKLVGAVREASLSAAEVQPDTQRSRAHESIQPPSRNTLPPPPMVRNTEPVETGNNETEIKLYFKKRFLEFYKNDYLNKLRECGHFEEAFDFICRKTYLAITSERTGNAAERGLLTYVTRLVDGGPEDKWRAVIRGMGESAVASEAQETMDVYVPIITSAYLSHDKYREIIRNIKDNNEEDYRAKQEDAAGCVLDYIRKQMFNADTSSQIESLVFLSYYFRESKSDLALMIKDAVTRSTGEFFDKLRKARAQEVAKPADAVQAGAATTNTAQEAAVTAGAATTNTAQEAAVQATQKEEKSAEEQSSLLMDLASDDLDDEVTVVEENTTVQPVKEEEAMQPDAVQQPAIVPAAAVKPAVVQPALRPAVKAVMPRVPEDAPLITYRIETAEPVKPESTPPKLDLTRLAEPRAAGKAPRASDAPVAGTKEIENLPEKTGGLWNRFKKSKVSKWVTGAALAAATVLAGYGAGLMTNTGRDAESDGAATAAASGSASMTGGTDTGVSARTASTTGVSANAAGSAADFNTDTDVFSAPAQSPAHAQSPAEKTADADPFDLSTPSTELTPTPSTQTPAEATPGYTIHPEKIAGKDTRLKKLLESESLSREAGARGDFEQLHNIVAQGALTADQQNRLQNELNDKYNRGEYGAATKRFRPLLKNGQLFKVLGDVTHPEHSALKAATEKYGNPSYWTWNRKKPVMEDGKFKIISVPYEEMHSADIDFYTQCNSEFEQVGIGKNGNVHYRGGEAGERIPLKINDKWITFVETALQIRGVIETQAAGNARPIPAPPASILNEGTTAPDGTTAPAQTAPDGTTPTNTAPLNLMPDAQPGDINGKTGYLDDDSPEIEIGDEVEVDLDDLEDEAGDVNGKTGYLDESVPEIEAVETEMDRETMMAVIDADWEEMHIKAGEVVELAMSDLEDDPDVEAGGEVEVDLADLDESVPEIEAFETEMDRETMMAVIDADWEEMHIEKAIEKTLKQVKMAA